MHCGSILRWLLLVSMGCFSTAVAAVQCEAIFTNALQSNDAGGSVSLSFNADLRDGSDTIDTPSLSSFNNDNCSGDDCVASGSPAASSDVTIPTGTGSDGAINVTSGTVSEPEGDYTTVSVGFNRRLNFTTSDGTYYTNSINLSSQADLYLSSGDYYIDGNLTLNSQARLRQLGSGTVRIFVTGNVSFQNQTRATNGFSNNGSELLIYAQGNITVGSSARVNGFLYSQSTLTMNNSSRVEGAVSGASVTLTGDARIGYSSSVLDSLDFSPFCDDTVPAVLVGYWRLDEGSWDGTSGEVLDQSGNGLNGTSTTVSGNRPVTSGTNSALAGDPGTCRYGEFDGSSDGHVEVADNALLDFFTSFSVAVWVYPRSFPSSGLQTIVSKDTNFEFHTNSSGRINWWWGSGSGQFSSNSPLTLNAWNHVAITYIEGEQIIYINGVEDQTNNSTHPLQTNGVPLFIGTDYNFVSRNFDGYLDEVRVYEGVLTPAQVLALTTDTHDCPISLNHYAITGETAGVACAPLAIKVTAHDPNHNSVSAGGVSIDLSTSTGKGSWSGIVTGEGSGSLTDTTYGDGSATYVFDVSESEVTLLFDYPDVPTNGSETFSINITDGSRSEDPSEDPTIEVAHAGFRFVDSFNNSVISTQVAGRQNSDYFLQAVRTDTNTGECAGIFGDGDTVAVELAAECNNPSSCAGIPVDVTNNSNTTSLTSATVNDDGSTGASAYQTVNLRFGADSRAPLAFEYDDVGFMSLHARYQMLLSDGTPSGQFIRGTSNEFVVKPYTIAFAYIRDSGGVDNPATQGAGAGFVAAGEDFQIRLQVRDEEGDTAPNFGNESFPESVSTTIASINYPSGGSLGSFVSGAFSKTAPGTFTSTTSRWNEVGTIELTADVDGSYLGVGGVDTVTNSGNVGRFYPDRFALTGSAADQCTAVSPMTYMGEPLTNTNYTITALNVQGDTTANYDEPTLSWLNATAVNQVAENNNDGVALDSRFTLDAASQWVVGEYIVTAVNVPRFSRSVSGAPEAAKTNLILGVAVNDTLDSRELETPDMNSSTSGACGGSCTAKALNAVGMNTVYGRLRVADAYGPENADLPVEFVTEYWIGSSAGSDVFIRNQPDSCTALDKATADIRFNGSAINPASSSTTVTLGSNTTNGVFGSAAGASVNLMAGDAGLRFSAPNGSVSPKSFPISIDLSSYPWLWYDWDDDGNHAESVFPNATITFDSYRGHDRVIYWRERYDL